MIEFKSILVPIDFSEHCDESTPYASWFAQHSDAIIHAVHVVTNPADDLYEPQEVPYWVMVEHAQKKAHEMLEEGMQRCLPASSRREVHVLEGDPYEKIIETAKAVGADLIVMTSHGRGGVKHLVMGSVAEKIVRHAPCAVFVVRRAK
jgi:nucleotide-binding universal stress UspA family protein